MPTYEYECPEGHGFEVFQRMTDEPAADCPQCGASARRKISGGAGFLFKGEGFYITDYRSDEYKKKASEEGKAAPAKAADAKSGEGKGGEAKGADAKGSSAGAAKGSSGSASKPSADG